LAQLSSILTDDDKHHGQPYRKNTPSMTIDQITEAIQPHKPVSKRQVIRYLNDCEIRPIGNRQRPQRYPDNAPNRILVHLGIVPDVAIRFAADSAGNGVTTRPYPTRKEMAGILREKRRSALPSMRQLRNERKKARGK
jgi:hypothetical protein